MYCQESKWCSLTLLFRVLPRNALSQTDRPSSTPPYIDTAGWYETNTMLTCAGVTTADGSQWLWVGQSQASCSKLLQLHFLCNKSKRCFAFNTGFFLYQYHVINYFMRNTEILTPTHCRTRCYVNGHSCACAWTRTSKCKHILRSQYDSQAQSVVLGMSTTISLPLLVLPSDGEVTMVTVGVGDGAALGPVDQTNHEQSIIFVMVDFVYWLI